MSAKGTLSDDTYSGAAAIIALTFIVGVAAFGAGLEIFIGHGVGLIFGGSVCLVACALTIWWVDMAERRATRSEDSP